MENPGPQSRVQQAIAENREWLEKNGADCRARALVRVEEELQNVGSRSIRLLSSDLDSLSLFYGARGVIGVLDDLANGWGDVDMAALYAFWEMKLFVDGLRLCSALGPEWECGYPTSSSLCRASQLLAYALLVGWNAWQHELWDSLLVVSAEVFDRLLADGTPGAWEERVFEPFMMRLYEKTREVGLPPHVASLRLGPYDGIFKHWQSPERLASALSKACDYHCEKMISQGSGEEFYLPPFVLYPVEILAIYKVRERLGLETPVIDHPLMTTPLASLARREVAQIDDPLIRRVEQLHRDFFANHPLPPVTEFKPLLHPAVGRDHGPRVNVSIEENPDDSYDRATGEHRFGLEAAVPGHADPLARFTLDLPSMLFEYLSARGPIFKELVDDVPLLKVVADVYRRFEETHDDIARQLTELIDSPDTLSARLSASADPRAEIVKDPRVVMAVQRLFERSQSDEHLSSLLTDLIRASRNVRGENK